MGRRRIYDLEDRVAELEKIVLGVIRLSQSMLARQKKAIMADLENDKIKIRLRSAPRRPKKKAKHK